MEPVGGFTGEVVVAGLALHLEVAVADFARRRVAQLDRAIDPGVDCALVPDVIHGADPLVDKGNTSIADVRAAADLLTASHPVTSLLPRNLESLGSLRVRVATDSAR